MCIIFESLNTLKRKTEAPNKCSLVLILGILWTYAPLYPHIGSNTPFRWKWYWLKISPSCVYSKLTIIRYIITGSVMWPFKSYTWGLHCRGEFILLKPLGRCCQFLKSKYSSRVYGFSLNSLEWFKSQFSLDLLVQFVKDPQKHCVSRFVLGLEEHLGV